MSAAIDAFLDARGQLAVNKSLLVGYDFMQDGLEAGDAYLAAAGLAETARTRLLGNDWTVDSLKEQLFGDLRTVGERYRALASRI